MVLEVVLGVAFLVSGAESAIDEGLSRAGLDFGSDLLTAGRVVVVYPAALLGVALALSQVAAPDLAVLVVARIRGGRALCARSGGGSVLGRTRSVPVTDFGSGSSSSSSSLPQDFAWHFSWSMLALLPVAMFLDAGALLEENGWRGFALPVLLRTHGPLAASLLVGLAWATWHFPVKFDAFLDYGLWGALAYLVLHSQDRRHLCCDDLLLGPSRTGHHARHRHARPLQ